MKLLQKTKLTSQRWYALFQNESGLGLSESLVAVAILGTAILSLTMALSTGTLAVGTTREGATAQSLAQSQLAYTKSYPFSSGTTTYPSAAVYHATYNPHPITLPAGYSITIMAAATPDNNSDIQKVTATVYRNGESKLTMEEYKVNR